jgi:hypothetical protein
VAEIWQKGGPSGWVLLRARMRHELRRTLAAYPSVYLPVMRRKVPGSVLGPGTDLVIDGFTRSAVTFTVVAFQLAQNDHVRVAHHLHAPAHLIAAAKQGVPCLVPIREPKGAILSALIREPRITPKLFLKSYVDFYQRIAPYRDQFVIATFEQATTNLGSAISHVNTRFGTRFRTFQHTEHNERAVFALIEERARRPPWEELIGAFLSGAMSADEFREATRLYREIDPDGHSSPVPEARVQRPSDERRALARSIEPHYRAPNLMALREHAELLYELFAASTESTLSP